MNYKFFINIFIQRLFKTFFLKKKAINEIFIEMINK